MSKFATRLQFTDFFPVFDALQLKYGDPSLSSIYGAGELQSPDTALIFMNPTGRNVSASKTWKGLRAPWLGTKKVWNMLTKLSLFDAALNARIQEMNPQDWTTSFAENVYCEVKRRRLYITNFAKCTQIDARPLSDAVFTPYREFLLDELIAVNPRVIITFGNQVSSLLLNKRVSVRTYFESRGGETLHARGKTVPVFPVYYPVGQGQRNEPLAIAQINWIRETYFYGN